VGWKFVRLREEEYEELRRLKEERGLSSFSDVIAELLRCKQVEKAQGESVENNGVEKPLEKSKQQELEESGGLSSKSVGSSVVSLLRILEHVRRIYSEKLGEDLALDETATLLLLRIIHCETGRDPTKELRRGRTWQELVEEFESELMKMLPKPLRDAFTNAR
jgi:predicted CopG family antitoxin